MAALVKAGYMVTFTADVIVIGGGLAGSEAAWQLVERGLRVELFEMRPSSMTPAHHTGDLAELVCSNSMKSTVLPSAPALLKAELEILGSLILALARKTSIGAGTALAVDRQAFSSAVTEAVSRHPRIKLSRREQSRIGGKTPTIVATGPLTSPEMEQCLARLVGAQNLYFFDAAAPLIDTSTIDHSRCFEASRYGKGDGTYINCPMDEAQYDEFHEALCKARRALAREFEKKELFSACQPVEEIALRGADALRYGPMKPVGLTDPATGLRPHAVVQLRPDNAAATLYNMVGFQTNLAWPEQERVFRMIPGLEHAEFTRYGVMHRNTFVDSPRALGRDLALLRHPHVFLAGQITGSEGYLEAAATGLVAALNAFARVRELNPAMLPATTAIGALVAYLSDTSVRDFQPHHANLGLLPPLAPPVRNKKARHEALAKRALSDLGGYLKARVDLRFGGDNGTA